MLRLVILLIAGIAFAADERAASAAATKLKCTCDLVQEDVPNKGAIVVNGGVCVRHDFPDREWCRIFPKFLEDQEGKKEYVIAFVNGAVSSSSNLKNELMNLYGEYKERTVADIDARDDEMLAVRIDQNYDYAKECIDKFAQGRPISRSDADNTFRCSVGSESKWLSLSYRIFNRAYTFLFSPN